MPLKKKKKSKITLEMSLIYEVWEHIPPRYTFITIGKLALNYMCFEKCKVFMNLFLT